MAYGSLSPLLIWFLRLPPVQWLLSLPWIARLVSRLAINAKVCGARFRPYPYSLWTRKAAEPLRVQFEVHEAIENEADPSRSAGDVPTTRAVRLVRRELTRPV